MGREASQENKNKIKIQNQDNPKREDVRVVKESALRSDAKARGFNPDSSQGTKDLPPRGVPGNTTSVKVRGQTSEALIVQW